LARIIWIRIFYAIHAGPRFQNKKDTMNRALRLIEVLKPPNHPKAVQNLFELEAAEGSMLRKIARETTLADRLQLACWTLAAIAIQIFVFQIG
jgi:hypothetical protein